MATNNSIDLKAAGIAVYDGAGTFSGRTLTAGSSKISISNGTGVVGDPTVDAVEANFTLNNIGGTLGPTKGGTGLTTYAQGDLIYGSAANTLSALSKDTNATRYLSNTGTSNNPAWAQITLSNGVTGQLPLANGGTNANLTASNGGIFYSTSTAGAILSGTATAGQILRSGSSAAPSWSTATYPSTATGTGAILRADGTNWAASTATYPNTTTSQQLLYSTANNVIGELTTANSKFPATNSSGTLAMRALSVVIQTFTSNGTYTPTTGMQYCIIEVIGSGGGGGGTQATSASQVAQAGGGGSGEYARGVFSAATIGASQSVTVPTGGNGGSAGLNNGSNGSTTSVGALISAAGGSGGIAGTASTTSILASGGSGGTGGSGGSFRVDGRSGEFGLFIVGSFQYNGRGAPSLIGGTNNIRTSTNAGLAGKNYGCGGDGAFASISAAGQAGGNGGGGIVVVTEFVIN